MAATVNVCLAFACVLLVAFFPVLYHIGYRHAEDRHYELARQKAL